MNQITNYSPQLLKLVNKLGKIYNSCIITKQYAELHPIVPFYYINKYSPYLNFCKYLYMPLSKNIINDYQNFKFTIMPDPTTIFYENKNGKIIKGGIFIAINPFGQTCNVVLLYNCRVFLKWHFLKYLEVNNINPSIYNYTHRYINSEVYLHDIILQINNIDNENIFDASGCNIMI